MTFDSFKSRKLFENQTAVELELIRNFVFGLQQSLLFSILILHKKIFGYSVLEEFRISYK